MTKTCPICVWILIDHPDNSTEESCKAIKKLISSVPASDRVIVPSDLLPSADRICRCPHCGQGLCGQCN